MLTVPEAAAAILRHATPRPVEDVRLAEAAGRVLREELRADRDLPPFDRVTMDGIALDHRAFADGRRTFRIEGIQPAGAPAVELRESGACLEVMTGAVLPRSADTVVPYEELDRTDTEATVRPEARVAAGQFIHRAGSDRRRGDLLLPAGRVLRSPQIAIAASIGRDRLRVSAPPRVRVVSVGDELVEVGEPLQPYQIRPSNAYGLRAALHGAGIPDVRLALLPDRPEEMERILAAALAECDMILLSGGVSKGRYDYVPRTLARLGVQEVFHRVQQKPGQPLWFGVRDGRQPVFALPGNPVSTTICFHRFVVPYLWACAGAEPPVPLAVELGDEVRLASPLTHFLPVRVEPRTGRLAVARLQTYHGSGDYAALGESHGFVELPPESGHYAEGTVVQYYPWHS